MSIDELFNDFNWNKYYKYILKIYINCAIKHINIIHIHIIQYTLDTSMTHNINNSQNIDFVISYFTYKSNT